MSYADWICLFLVCGLFLTIIITISLCERREYYHGTDNYHVGNIILTYRIITNTTKSYSDIYKILKKSETFCQVAKDVSVIVMRGYRENLLTIVNELKQMDEVDTDLKKELDLITTEKIRIVDVARKTERLKSNCP